MLSYFGSDGGQSIYYKKLFIREIVSFNNFETQRVCRTERRMQKKKCGSNNFFSLEIQFT